MVRLHTVRYKNLPPLTHAQLKTIATAPTPPGYPTTRLSIKPEKWERMVQAGRIIIPHPPDAPWRVDTHPNRVDAPEHSRHLIQPSIHEQPISQEQIQAWHEMGLDTDAETGEPIHYYAGQIITTVGMWGGLGFLFQHGPQGTAAQILRRHRAGQAGQYVAIKRRDNGIWTLPNGFREPGEPAEVAAPRECWEEAGLDPKLVGGLAVATHTLLSACNDWDTLNAWTERTVVTIRNPNQEYLWDAELVAGDDAVDVAWYTIAEASELVAANQFSIASLRYMQETEAAEGGRG